MSSSASLSFAAAGLNEVLATISRNSGNAARLHEDRLTVPRYVGNLAEEGTMRNTVDGYHNISSPQMIYSIETM